jgi:sec-independent protein translocase protein TatB
MFDVGFWELFILFGLGLIILGPERLPKVAMQVGNWAGQARRMARQLSGQIRSEINDLDIPNEIDIKDPFASTTTSRATPNYNRPGVDDLKPSNEESPAQSSSQSPESDDTTADKAD